MKHHLPHTLFACLGVLWLALWAAVAQAQTDTPDLTAVPPRTTHIPSCTSLDTLPARHHLSLSYSEPFTADRPVDLSLSGLRLVADSGSLMHDVVFTVATLSRSDAQPLASNMLSVTAGSHAYRLLPGGEHFSADQPAHIELAYEPLSLPHGFQPRDIHTYYFDEPTRRWQRLHRLAIDTARHVVISETTHFTDFINAVLRTPDMPEVSAFVPTTLADMEDPHPLSRVPMVAAPEANTYGTASVTYPIDLPAGRNGLQPDLTLSYSSDRGNGIMGVGWSFPQPAITLDTRWGVPRYDSKVETEIYTLNGLQLVQKDGNPDLRLPYQTNTPIRRQTGDVLFVARDPKNADRVIRHGTQPSNYYFTVTDRSGTTYYYGKYASDKTVNANCVLKDAHGNIAHWALAEVVDLHGNYMKYEYHIDAKGNEIYPRYIYYTGYRSPDGRSDILPSYRVRFHYDFESKRLDSFSDARLGFVRETAHTLCNIDISYRDGKHFEVEDRCEMWYSTLHSRSYLSYILLYNIPEIRKRGECNKRYDIDSLHHYCLFDCDIASERRVSFLYDHIMLQNIFSDEEVTIEDDKSDINFLNAASSQGWSVGGTLTVGLGKEIWNTNFSAGGNYDYSESSGQTDMMLLDMDGDGLPDKVYCYNGYIHYRKQVVDLTSGVATFAPAQNIGIRADHLSHEQSTTHSWGLQAGASGKVIQWGATVSGGWSKTTTYTDCYFADVNADGLPDYVDNGVVYFNQLRNGKGFIKHSGARSVIIDSTLCKPFYYDGVVDTEVECYWDTVLIDTYTPDITPYLPVDEKEEIGCSNCEKICRDYLYGGQEDMEQECLNCSKLHPRINLDCPECYDQCASIPLSEVEHAECVYRCKQEIGDCPRICPQCLEEYVTYGTDSDPYLTCADEKCIFPYTIACEKCRDTCTYFPFYCDRCVMDTCEEAYPYIVDGMEICEECNDDCQSADFEKCNDCKVDHYCRGVIDYDALDQCNPANYGEDVCVCIDALYNEDAICKECQDVCALTPESCLRCMSRHCYYRNPEDIADSLRHEMKSYWKRKYPTAIIKTVGNTMQLYIANQICPQEVSSEPNIEAVRVWVAPYKGTINLTSTVHLLEDTSALRRQSRTADGVRCVIQHNSGVSRYSHDGIPRLSSTQTHLIGTRNIPANDYLTHEDQYNNITVKQGDILFFHLMSRGNHNFDNVDWTQSINYVNRYNSYNSVSDFICTDDRTFQSGLSGRLAITVFVESESSHTGTLKMFYKGDCTHTTTINSSTKWVEIPASNYNAGESVYFTLASSGNDYGNWDVRVRLTLAGAQDTIVSYVAPRMSLPREVKLDSVYYDLFGPLYRGWGQFALNNKEAADLIPIDSLYNTSKVGAQTINNDTTAFRQSFSQFQNMDTTAMLQDGTLESSFRTAGFYNPLDHYWVEMTADARLWQWEAYGQVGRIGRHTQSNTRVRRLTSTTGETITTSSTTTYDNPVPVSDGHITAIRKTGSSEQKFFSMGANIGTTTDNADLGIGGGLSHSRNTYWVTADYIDMNGDRYPDIVRQSTIQYTNPWGGLGKSQDVGTPLHKTYTSSRGKSLSGTYAKTQKIPGNNPKRDDYTVSQSGSSSYCSSNSVSYTKFVLMDVNGDGLPDKIEQVGDSMRIYLNIGYGFADYYTRQGRLGINYSNSKNGNVNFGDFFSWANKAKKLLDSDGNLLNTAQGSFQMSLAFGINTSSSENYTSARLIDIDGDGHLDYVAHDGKNMLIIPTIDMNNHDATDYSPDVTPQFIQHSTTTNSGINLGITGGIPIWFVKICIGVQTTPLSFSATTQTHDLIDMNGDGLPDLVRADKDGIHVRYNQMGRQGLLKKITNPTGNQIDLSYRLSPPDIEQPHRQWLLDSVRITNPSEENINRPATANKFVYADPHYDVEERCFYGYGSVTTHALNTEMVDDPAYRTRICRYNNHDYADRGKLIYDARTDEYGNIYTEYELGISYTDANGRETDDLCNDTKIRIGTETHFTRYFEGGRDSIVTAKQYDYDRYHNVIAYRNMGYTHLDEDDIEAAITYRDATSGTNLTRNLVSLPTSMTVSAGQTVVRKDSAIYDAQGRLTRHTQTDPTTSEERTTDYSYNSYGLVEAISLPENYSQQRASISIAYDDYSRSLPTSVTNQWGHTSYTDYHPYWQLPTTVTDVAGQTMQYEYDDIGRLTSVTAPNEDGAIPTIRYTYYPRKSRWIYSSRQDERTRLSYVDVQTYSDADETFHRTFCDARGDIVQRLDRRENMYVVSRRTERDGFGRATAVYANVWKNGLTSDYYADHLNLIAQTEYDVMDRPVITSWADGTESVISYEIGTDALGVRRLAQYRTDENGLLWQQFTSPQGWLTTTIAPDAATTTFHYDALGQLLQSTDPDGLTTTHTYDGFGRRTERNHPDAGTTRWTYDAAGNLIASATQMQIDNGEETTYEYDYTRLTAVHYPRYPQQDISYEYEPETGRLNFISDITGYEYLEYDLMGNVSRSDKTIVLPTENYAYTFTTSYYYDSFGRMRNLTYPDGEKVNYIYRDGQLCSIRGNADIPYVQNIRYDCYGHIIHQQYGNGLQTDIFYDEVRQRPHTRQTYTSDDIPLQDISYTYDNADNITHIYQGVDKFCGMGGAYNVEYSYDEQYRLIQAQQSSADLGDYQYSMSYSLSGLLGEKICPELGTDIVYGYRHGENTTYASHRVATLFPSSQSEEVALSTWNANGELTSIVQPFQDRFRRHWWNEAGQLALSVSNESCGYYAYDARGERTYKLTGVVFTDQYDAGTIQATASFDDAVLYVNPYMVVTPRGYTKHYYNGSQRIAARIGGYWHDESVFVSSPALTNAAESLWAATLYKEELREQETPFDEVYVSPVGVFLPVAQYGPVVANLSGMHADDLLSSVFSGHNSEQLDYDTVGIYFYHSDHLGSANWITNSQGEAVQYLHYMPFGELWADQQFYAYDERYKFTGKERDTETGYDYFGARYYASTLPMWLSVDPLADKYSGINPYAYCVWNPIMHIDPDGKKVYFAKGVSPSFKEDFRIAVKYMNANGLSKMLHELELSPNTYYIAERKLFENSSFNTKTRTINWSPRTGFITDNLYEMSPVEVLIHEIDHALQYDLNPLQQNIDGHTYNSMYGNEEERRVIEGSEQRTAQKLGKVKENEVTRNNHNGSPYETESAISNKDKNYHISTDE